MKKSGILMLLLSVLFCCVLSGCADLLKSEDMDREVENLIQALNEDDADRIFLSMYPGVVTREEFDKSYAAVREIWEPSDGHTTKLRSINTRKNVNKSGDYLICQAQYYVYTQAQDYTITLTYRCDDNGDGVYQFNLNAGAEPVLVSGGFTTAGKNSALQWALLLLSVLSYLLIIVTVVDILRKRPRLFGVWLAAALSFIGFWIQAAPASFHVGGSVTWFVFSSFKIYSTGGRQFVFALPVGAIVYWCLRKKLLSQKMQGMKGITGAK
ncbi:MAG: hypothetical protein K2I96_10765 [Lachnospiraceae bacterium]|nr:hypothetical protein [Lachnospiraceae bacterium]